MVPLCYFFYGLWGSALLFDNILHNIAWKAFCLQCNAARTWMKECLCNFYIHVYCICMLVVSVPQLTKLWKIVLNIAGRRMGGEQLDVALPVSWIEASETYPDGSEQVQLHTQLRTHIQTHKHTETDTRTHGHMRTHRQERQDRQDRHDWHLNFPGHWCGAAFAMFFMSYHDKHRQPRWFEKNKAHALLVVKAPALARKSGLLVPSSVPSAVLHGSLSRDCIRSARLIEQSKRSRSPSHKSWPAATQRLLVTCTRHSTIKKTTNSSDFFFLSRYFPFL